MSAEMMAKLGLDQSSYQNGLASATRAADKFAGQISSTMKTLGTAVAGAFAFDRIIGGFTSAIDKGDQLQDLANRFGVSASALQEVGNAASLSGASIEDVAKAFNTLAKNAGAALGGNKELKDNFELIGVSLQDLQRLSPEELFFKLSDAISSGSLGARDFDVAMSLAGKSAAALMETMSMGSSAIQSNGQAMGVWSDQTISALSEASDNIKKFENTLTIAFGNAVPVIDRLIKRYQDLVEAFVLSGNARRNPNLDDLGQAALFEEAGNLVSGKTGRTKETPAAKPSAKLESKLDAQDKELADFKKKIEEENGDYAKKLLQDAARDEEMRAIRRERMLAEFRQGLEQDKIRAEKMAAERAAAQNANRGARGMISSSATETLDKISGLGGGMGDVVARERKKQAQLQAKADREAMDRAVRATTAEKTADGGVRTMVNRRNEYIANLAKTEARGQKTLTDVWAVLDKALNQIVSAPMVGGN
jgi:hypothetical protein